MQTDDAKLRRVGLNFLRINFFVRKREILMPSTKHQASKHEKKGERVSEAHN